MMTQKEMKALLEIIQKEEMGVREDGQKEYARNEENAFQNFEWISKLIGVPREKVLLIYALKHLDGIMSYVDGHKSQRENVRGRITDLRLYLALLWGMINDTEFPREDSIVEGR